MLSGYLLASELILIYWYQKYFLLDFSESRIKPMVFQRTDEEYLNNVVNTAYIINILQRCHKWHYEFLNVNLISQLILKSVIL